MHPVTNILQCYKLKMVRIYDNNKLLNNLIRYYCYMSDILIMQLSVGTRYKFILLSEIVYVDWL